MSSQFRCLSNLLRNIHVEAGRYYRHSAIGFGGQLSALRERGGLDAYDLAERAELSRAEIDRLEFGTAIDGPELAAVLRYVRACARTPESAAIASFKTAAIADPPLVMSDCF